MHKVYIKKIEELERILKYGQVESDNLQKDNNTIMELTIDDDKMSIIFDGSKIYYRVPEIAKERVLFGVCQLITILGNYIPIHDMNNNLIFTKEQFDVIRSKMQGLKHYGSSHYSYSNNLDFPGIKGIVDIVDNSLADSNKKRLAIVNLLKNELIKNGITVGLGNNSDMDVSLIDIGSTGRGTNIPYDADFDFIARVNPKIFNDPSKLISLKTTMISILGGNISENLLHGQLREVKCNIPNINDMLTVDITFTSSEKPMEYTTELAVIDRLETMKNEDDEKYKKTIANIIFAKQFLKKHNVYKPSRSDKEQAGIGGIGLENLIIQNGGSFYDAACEFLRYAQDKDYIEFEKSYPLFDFGKNHVSVEKKQFPYDNFIMKNMRKDGYIKMCECLKEYVDYVEKESYDERTRRQ